MRYHRLLRRAFTNTYLHNRFCSFLLVNRVFIKLALHDDDCAASFFIKKVLKLANYLQM